MNRTQTGGLVEAAEYCMTVHAGQLTHLRRWVQRRNLAATGRVVRAQGQIGRELRSLKMCLLYHNLK
jgi:hypothetical protein